MVKYKALAAFGWIALTSAVCADPIHRQADGAYWHHDSGWIFPEKIGDFVRVSEPQDVAGSRDAVAYYARERDGERIVASVDVFPADSAADATTLESAKAALQREAGAAPLVESTLALGDALQATEIVARGTADDAPRALYFVTRGEWRVRIVFTGAQPGKASIPGGVEFVRGQRWDTWSSG